MSRMDGAPHTRRSRIVSIALIAAFFIAAIVFYRPLVAWFTGKSTGGGEGAPVTAHAGPFSIQAALDPDPPRQTGDALVLELKDASGAPIEGARVSVDYDMPAMGAMAEMRGPANVADEGKGRYRATFDLPMSSGTWSLIASIHAPQGDASQTFTMTIGAAGLTAGSGTGAAMQGMPGMSGSTAPPAPPAASGSGAPGEVDHYTCSMHPSVNQPGPGTCPICGMNLMPVTKEQQERGVVTIDRVRQQLIGVRTGLVVEAPMQRTIRAVGLVSYDESALADVNLKVRGWITSLRVSETGQRVTRGQTLFTLYSPELYNAQQDFLLAAKGAGTGSELQGGSRLASLAGPARQRLRLLGMTDEQIDGIAKSGTPMESVAFASPASGFVIEKNAVEGASVDAGTRIYRIAALSNVWIEAQVYEADLEHIRVGQRADVTLAYLPGRSYEAKVAYVYPYLDSSARTGKVRIELANNSLDLRPGMYATVSLAADLGKRMQVPASAVVYVGPRRLVFVDLGEGRFEPRPIQVGLETDGVYEVLSGLSPGEVVATSGVFLIGADARISTTATYWEQQPEAADAGGGSGMPAPAPAPTAPRAPSSAPGGSSSTPAPSASSPAPAPTVYTCPMHPEVQSPQPGKCPKCGMDLVPKGGTK